MGLFRYSSVGAGRVWRFGEGMEKAGVGVCGMILWVGNAVTRCWVSDCFVGYKRMGMSMEV